MVTWHLTPAKMPRGQHCENYDVKRETVHCYPWNVDRCCTWSEVAWCYRWNLGMFFKICFVFFYCITNHAMTGPLGNRKLCFLRISIFPSTSSREAWRFSGNKIHWSPRDQSLSVNYKILAFLYSKWALDWSVDLVIHVPTLSYGVFIHDVVCLTEWRKRCSSSIVMWSTLMVI